MEETKEIAEGNHDGGGGAAGNIEQSQKFKLAEMPIEILEHILVHLDDESLLRASHVCTLFASVAETSFERKYFNKYYEVLQWSDAKMSFHEVMLSKYGKKIRKLEIRVEKKDERLLDLAERECCNLNSLYLHDSPKIILSKNLKEARLVGVDNLNRASFTEFINKNQQLEVLQLEYVDIDLLDLLDGLSKLKTLEYDCYPIPVNDLPTIKLVALETLGLSLSDAQDYVRVLRAITCNELKSLFISGIFIDVPDGVFDQICSFQTLATLQLGMYKVTEDQLKVLAQQMPLITEFGMGMTDNVDHTIQLALRSLPKLTKLTIAPGAGDYHKLSDDLKRSMQDFHTRFVVNNVEIEFIYDESVVSISKDRTVAFNSNTELFELLWMENLNEKNVRKVLNGPTKDYKMSYLKITNDCVDSALDVSKFMHECFNWTKTVDIKSKGPITVNANATRLPLFFPDLKVLKIQLENHSVVDLLLKLDEKFCKRIEELSIDTTDVQNADDQEVEQGNDITHILCEFENLKSLEVVAPAINFDTKHLQAMCPNLNDLRIRRHNNQ